MKTVHPGSRPPPLLALVLGGGAARGAAHIGALRALVEDGLVPDLLVGVSMGAIVGAVFAMEADHWRALERLERAAAALQERFADLAAPVRLLRALHLFGRRQRRRWLKEGLGLGDLNFGQLHPPLLVTAARIFPPGRSVLGTTPGESVLGALMATSAMPSRLPVRYGRTLLMDGAMAGNLPALPAVAHGARVIVAANLGFLFKRREDIGRFFPWRMIDRLGKAQMAWELQKCWRLGATVIEIGPGNIEAESIIAFEKLDKLIEEGYKATKLRVPAIKGALQKARVIPSS